MASIVTDIKDFETCFHQHFEMLHHYAYTIVKDSDEAKDIVQAAFVKLWALYTNLEIKHSVKAYLYRSVYNLSINYLRDARTRHRHVSLAATCDRFK